MVRVMDLYAEHSINGSLRRMNFLLLGIVGEAWAAMQ